MQFVFSSIALPYIDPDKMDNENLEYAQQGLIGA